MNILSRIRWPHPFAGLRGITLADVPREAMAGVTLAALMIPLNIGYAQVAGLPPAAGLYAAIIPLVVFALLASSRHLVTSPDASMATLVGATLVAFAAPGLLAAAEHLKETLATSVQTEGYFVEVLALIHSIPHVNLYSVAIGVSTFLIVRLMKRYAPKIPGALVAFVLLTTLVANAVLSLMEVHEFKELWRMRRSEFWIAMVCLLSVLALGPLRAVMIAFLLSVIDVIRRASRPVTSALLEAPDGSHFLPADERKASGSSSLMVYRFGAPLYFANATLFLDDVERLVTQAATPVRWFVLDAQAMVDVDTTGAGVLRQAITLLKKRDITFAVSRADRSFRSWLGQYHLMELIDPGRFYPTNRHAAQAFRQSSGSATAAPDSSAI